MRVVLDTNVVVSAVISVHGTCAQILDMLVDGVFDLYADDLILAEYDSVLRRAELRIQPADADVVLELIRSVADSVAAVPFSVRLPDPNDTPFLEVAAASSSILVTGNTRHCPRSSRTGVAVLTPREFIEFIPSSE